MKCLLTADKAARRFTINQGHIQDPRNNLCTLSGFVDAEGQAPPASTQAQDPLGPKDFAPYL